ncbi:hypothetical protein CLV24_10349 [Pontibacter ummariensis]|uniref:UbiA prenyltransferase family protein n=1 Tax=Pontibacter ummariensis TaxID=1610492 RepID=A0A239CV41_9BACT|nr:hypothetical protein [Pontibacter ummariensis]PRY14812.1 hypothetical protein CLV24_10349 [Pontibacter ummariensis]SNS23970.1 hypothetical protein SAMN06296052_103264 [Pontibacter ummariensis]
MEQDRTVGLKEPQRHFLWRLPLRLLEALLYSSVFISACAFGLTVETQLLAGLPVSLPMAAFVFLSTLFTYNVSSIKSLLLRPGQKPDRRSAAWSQRNKRFLAALGIASLAGAVALYLSYGFRVNIWFVLHLALISVGYTVPVIYKARQVRPLRSMPLLKVFLIAYVWAMVTALLPLIDAGLAVWEPQALQILGRRFLFILALALLFDIRDYAYDKATNTLTFPGLVGVKNTKLLSLGLLVLYVLTALQTEVGAVQLALVGSAVGASLVVLFSSDERPRIYYAILADGAMLLHAGLVYLAFS